MASESIYGIEYEFPKPPKYGEVCNFKKSKREQKWEWEELPEIFEELEFDDDGEPYYTPEHLEYINQELDRIENGFWLFINGKLRYLTGVHYFYLKYFVLDTGFRPDYRDVDRKWFLFFDYCYKRPYITGIIRVKKRREGATSQAAAWALLTAITTKNANCGLISKKGEDSYDIFTKMIVPAYNKLPIFLKPRCEDDNPKTRLVFVKPKSKKSRKGLKKGDIYSNDRGMESRIDYAATQLNSYDGQRMTALICDEASKWVNTAINQYWPIAQQTLKVGAKKVGFALVISTVNEGEKGGYEYKALWDESSQFDNDYTGSGMYRYFSPAYEGYAGFIDEYGDSIVENATPTQRHEVKQNFGKEYDGAKDYILQERQAKNDPVSISEHVRMFPFTEKDAFQIGQNSCPFNTTAIYQQIEEVKSKTPTFRQIRFYMMDDGRVNWVDDSNGPWKIFKFPKDVDQNKWTMGENGQTPSNAHMFKIGVDPHRHNYTKTQKNLSKTAGWIGEALDLTDPENTGGPIGFYYDRPRLKEMMYEQFRLAAIFYGCKINFESDAGDDYYSYWNNRGQVQYLRKTPTCAINPLEKNRLNKRTFGSASKDMFCMAKQLEYCISYIESYCWKIWYLELLEELLQYDHADRTTYDTVVAFMMMLLDMIGDIRPAHDELPKGTPMVKTYKLRQQG